MDDPERLRQLLTACERAIERMDENSQIQVDVWLLEDLLKLRVDLQGRLNAGGDSSSSPDPS